MKPWEHPVMKKVLSQLKTIRKEKRTMDTPDGPKEFTVSWLTDDEGTIYIQLMTKDGENFFITPIRVLKEMIKDAERLLKEKKDRDINTNKQE